MKWWTLPNLILKEDMVGGEKVKGGRFGGISQKGIKRRISHKKTSILQRASSLCVYTILIVTNKQTEK